MHGHGTYDRVRTILLFRFLFSSVFFLVFCFYFYSWSRESPIYHVISPLFVAGCFKNVCRGVSVYVLLYIIRVAHGGSDPFVIYIYLFFISTSTDSIPLLCVYRAHFTFSARSLSVSLSLSCLAPFPPYSLARVHCSITVIYTFFLFLFSLSLFQNNRFAVPMDVYLVRL